MSGPAPNWITISPEVETALRDRRAVVALESAVFSHGLPRAEAEELAVGLDAAVRAEGAVPACAAVRDGRVELGLGPRQLTFLFDPGTLKVAVRDLGVAVAQGRCGGTTVAGTLAIAHAAGVRVASTGGIGGVHRGAEQTMDISADLAALSRYPVAVVCAGPKAICDPWKTAEALDSLGVTVVGFRTCTLPAFLAESTGVPLRHRLDGWEDIAAIMAAKRRVGDGAALLVVQAPPPDRALENHELEQAVDLAVARARDHGVAGADLTPFLLAALADLTGGRSIAANLAVLEANARLAARIAVADAAARVAIG
jgi:pseudouridine-5'-phosphate glycosidase